MSATAFRSTLTGLCSGAFQGATGVGGSIIMVSALSSKWGLKLPQIQSAATALPTQLIGNATSAAVLIASLTVDDLGSTNNDRSGASICSSPVIDIANVLAIAIPATLSVTVGTRIGSRISDTALKLLFGATLAGVAPLVLYKAYGGEKSVVTPRTGEASIISTSRTPLGESLFPDHALSRAHLAAAGSVMGFITGLVGVGGGPIIISYLSLQSQEELSPRQVVGTANLAMLPMMAVGAASHALIGNIVWRAALPLCVATMAGGAIGGLAAAHAPTQALQTALAGFLLLTGVSTSKKAFVALMRQR